MASPSTGIDLGSKTVRLLQGRIKGNAFVPTRYLARPREEGESGPDALGALLRDARAKAPNARIGITGQDTILRYSQVPHLTDAQLRSLMRFEIDELSQQVGGHLAADFNLLPIPPGLSGDDTVLVALARNEALDAVTAAVKGTGCSVGAFTPNSVALYDAFLKLGSVGEDGVLLANIGDENTDIAIVLGPDLAFARNVKGGGKLFTDALRERMALAADAAADVKHSLVNLAPQAKGRFRTPQEEKATNALLGAAGQFASLLQSTAALAKAQLKIPDLQISRALLCGGGSRLRGLGEYLAAATGWNVSLFDPLEPLELGSLPPDERALLEEERHEAVVALGLALASAETRLYRIDILPEAILQKKRFRERTSFVIGAAAIAALYLGAELMVTRTLAVDSREVARVAVAEAKKRRDVHDRAVKLVGDEDVKGRNAALADASSELELRAARGATLLAVDRALRQFLHPDLWVTRVRMQVEKSTHPDLGAAEIRRPIVTISGRGREGAERIDHSFILSTTKIAEQFPGVVPVQSAKTTSKGFEWELQLCLVPVRAAEATEAPKGG